MDVLFVGYSRYSASEKAYAIVRLAELAQEKGDHRVRYWLSNTEWADIGTGVRMVRAIKGKWIGKNTR